MKNLYLKSDMVNSNGRLPRLRRHAVFCNGVKREGDKYCQKEHYGDNFMHTKD